MFGCGLRSVSGGGCRKVAVDGLAGLDRRDPVVRRGAIDGRGGEALAAAQVEKSIVEQRTDAIAP
jgi:hypothetical protein